MTPQRVFIIMRYSPVSVRLLFIEDPQGADIPGERGADSQPAVAMFQEVITGKERADLGIVIDSSPFCRGVVPSSSGAAFGLGNPRPIQVADSESVMPAQTKPEDFPSAGMTGD